MQTTETGAADAHHINSYPHMSRAFAGCDPGALAGSMLRAGAQGSAGHRNKRQPEAETVGRPEGSDEMERFFFNVVDGRNYPDDHGTELSSLTAARVEAVKVLVQVLSARPQDFWETGCFSVTVTDRTGLTLFSIMVSNADAPSVQRWDPGTAS
jgi:hypothetical protein